MKKKLIKPRSLIFCKDRTNHNERLIYNYLLLKIKEDKQLILKEKEDIEILGYQYKGHNLQVSFKELKEHLNLTKKNDIVKMFHNLRKIDIEKHLLTDFNIGRKNKSSFSAKLIGDIKEYNSENKYFELTFSPLIIEQVLINVNDYTELFFEDLVKFKSKYSLILFEILKASYIPHFNNNKPLILSLEDFKNLLNIEKYNITNLKARVLKRAVDEISALTEYKLEYKFLRGDFGKSFKYIELTFNTKSTIKSINYIENKKVKNLTQKELILLQKEKLPENLLITQQAEEIRELRKALSIQTSTKERAIDELDAIYQERELCS